MICIRDTKGNRRYSVKNYKMKRIYITTIGFVLSVSAKAQNNDPSRDMEIKWSSFHLFEILVTNSFFAIAILYLIKMLLDHRIKNKLLEKGASDVLVTQLLQPPAKDAKNNVIKWICILGSSGIGLLLVSHFQPLGIHSLAIISISLAVGFSAYLLLMRDKDQK